MGKQERKGFRNRGTHNAATACNKSDTVTGPSPARRSILSLAVPNSHSSGAAAFFLPFPFVSSCPASGAFHLKWTSTVGEGGQVADW